MIRLIIVFLYKYFFLNQIIIKIISNKYKIDNYSFNFKNIIFEDMTYLKKILFSKKYFFNKHYDDRSIYYHSFDWLLAAKIIGGANSIMQAKKQIFNWLAQRYSFNSFVWSDSLISKRLINLIYNYDFYAVSSDKNEKKVLHEIILKHYFILKFALRFNKIDNYTIEILKTILLLSLIYNKKIDSIYSRIIKVIDYNINNYGFHNSNNPSYHAEFVNQLHEIRNIYLYFNLNVPDIIDYQINNMSSVLSNFFHKDNSLALFNGSNNANKDQIIKTYNLVKDLKPKKLDKIQNGILVYNDKRKKIFFDAIKPSNKNISKNMHASTLSFEMSSDKEKIITNCGSVEKRFGKKPEYLRYSAAHSTIIINNTNISELVEKKSYKRIPEKIIFDFEEDEDVLIWMASHDGYEKNFNKIVKRKIIISKKFDSIKGQDSIISTKLNVKKVFYNIRFHLTPHCSCLITNNHKKALIKTKLNQSWIFETDSNITLEDSIIIYDGKKIEKTKQIVISNYATSAKKTDAWSLTKK